MGKLRKIGKKIARGIRKVGRKLKKGLGKVAKAFGKLGPLGSLALSFILPGVGGAISNWFGNLPSSNFLVKIVDGIKNGASFIKEGVGTVFNKVTDAIEYGMNAVSKPFMQEGARGTGSAFRDFVSDVTGGFIEPSKDAKEYMNLTEGDTLFDATPEVTPEVKPEGKPSLLEGKGKDQTTKEFIKGSREYSAYKKIAPTQQFGQALVQEEESVAAYNASLIAAEKDYFSNVAQDVLHTDPLSSVRGSATPVSFINIDDIVTSNNPYQAWLQGIYGSSAPLGYTQEEALAAAQASNNYGFNLRQLGD